MHRVGSKGQLVIAKEIRDQLGIEPGWEALQRVVDGHVELHFFPPADNRSLKGILAPYTDVTIGPGEEWNRARERAWREAAWEEERPWLEHS
jgi:AbrB family looped-hinge helix DNA binding protein